MLGWSSSSVQLWLLYAFPTSIFVLNIVPRAVLLAYTKKTTRCSRPTNLWGNNFQFAFLLRMYSVQISNNLSPGFMYFDFNNVLYVFGCVQWGNNHDYIVSLKLVISQNGYEVDTYSNLLK